MTATFSERSIQLARKQYQDFFEKAFSDLGRHDRTVLVFYGEDGLGKTSLLRSLEQQHRSECVFLNVAKMQKHHHLGLEDVLNRLCSDLERDKLVLHNFKVAFAYYLNWVKIERAVDPYNSAVKVDRGDVVSTLGDLVDKIADELGKQVPVVGTISKLTWFVCRYGRNFGKYKDQLRKLDECADPYEILEQLPEFLMTTLGETLEKKGRKVAILVDGYEALLDEHGTCDWLEQMMAVENPHVLWVLTAKAAISTVAPDQQLGIQPLSYAESLEWLQTLGVEDREIASTVAIAAKGLPFLLQVGVETWNQIRLERTPRVEDFAQTLQASLERLGQVWQGEDLALMRVLSVARIWDQPLVEAAVQGWQLGDGQARWAQLMASPLVEQVGEGEFRVHSLLSQHLLESLSGTQQGEIDQWLYQYYRSLYAANSRPGTLLEAVYHGLRGSAVEEAAEWGLEQVPGLQERSLLDDAIALVEMVLHSADRLSTMVRARGRMGLGRSLVELGRSREAIEVLEEAGAEWTVLDQGESAEALATQLDLARAYLQEGRTFDARNAALRVKTGRMARFGEESLEVAEVLNLLATIAERQDHPREAISLREQAWRIFAMQSDLSPIQRVPPMKMQVMLLMQVKRLDEALQLSQAVLQLAREALGTEHPEAILSQALLGVVYEQMGQPRYQQAFDNYQQALEVGESILGVDHPQILLLLKCLERLCRKVREVEAASGFAERHTAHVQIRNFEETVETARRLNELGYTLYEKGEYGKVEPLWVRSLAIRQQQLGDDHPDVASSLNNLAALYESQGRYSEAEPLLRQSLAIRQQQFGDDHFDVAMSLNNLAELYYSQGRYSEAEPLYLKSLAIRQQQFGDDHPDVAMSLGNLAGLYRSQGRYSEAEPLYLKSLAIRQQQLGDDHPDVATSLNNLAGLYYSQGRYSEAEPLLRQSLAIWQQQFGDDHPDVAQSLNNLAALYESQGCYSEAEPLFRQSLAIWQQQFGDDHPDVAQSLNNLAYLYYSQGRYSEAEPLYLKSLAIRQRQLGDDHPDVAQSLNNLALLYNSQGRYSEVEPLFRQSLAIWQQQFGDDHPDVATSLNNLAALYESQGRYSAAEPLFRQSLEIREKKLGADHPHTQATRRNLESLHQEMS